MNRRNASPFFYSTVICYTFCLLLLTCVFADDEEEAHDDFSSDNGAQEHTCDMPPPPDNGELTCGIPKKKKNKYVCKAECDAGYQFPNKKKKRRHTCDMKSGEWTPDYIFPDCEPICNPSCENGGECIEGNHCICTPEYRGDRCQYGLDLCDPEKGLHVPAEWKCEHTTEQTTCLLDCPQGTRYESPPAETYHCSLDGTWMPSFAPKCIPINVIEAPAAPRMHPIATSQLVSSSLPNSGVCAVWGNSHFRTFDGGIYSFQGPCTYLLSKDCEQNTFAIHIQNAEPCETVSSCPTTLVIYLGSEQYVLTNGQGGGPTVQIADEIHNIPALVHGLLFEMLSGYVAVSSSLGFRLKWNRKNTVLLKASSQLQNRTCGLCGKFDGSVLNDFETSDGTITDSVEGFANSWTMDNLGEKCEEKAVVKDSCSENKDKVSEAETLCHVIFDNKFAPCHELVDPKVYFEVCKMDHCGCPFGSCYCGTLAEYFRECTRLGGKLDGGWRSSELCPLSCPEGMVYKDCGTSCPRTCSGTVYDCEENHCVDGCHCPDDMFLHDGKCVEKRNCPCMRSGKEYPNGARELVECNACECNAGEWECTKEVCGTRCTSAGDPHYTTFDGLTYEFYGSCSYYLVYNENFNIVQETGPCPVRSGGEPATEGKFCTNKVQVKYKNETLLLQPGIKVTFNRKSVELPVSTSAMTASMATNIFLKVNLVNGVNVLWDGQNRIYIDAPPSLLGQTAGLCGTFNKNQNDDFLTPSNDIEADVSSFASRWKATRSCNKRSRRGFARSPCESHPQKLDSAEELCSILKHKMFDACHSALDPNPYYKSCVADLCLCSDQDLSKCVCPIIADYGLACTTKGVIVNWVDNVPACNPGCSGGQIYRECGNPCTSSCAAIASANICTQECVQGCTCAEGMALNSEGFCIAVDQCPCDYENKEYLPSSVTVQGSNVCTCQGAQWQCRPGTLPELATLNQDLIMDDRSLKCDEENNEEYTQCREECPRTCQNMHLPVECKTEECKPGCRCKEGFLLDSEKERCVRESECGCLHGRQRYKEGESIRQSCNLCTCFEGAWECSERECPGVCSAWGESHFKTFDGKIFDFQGECEYILSKGKMTGASYSISVQNVPCGTSGVTCSKSFTVDLGRMKTSRGDIHEITAEPETLTLTKDEPLPRTSHSSRFILVEAGLFVMVYTDIGLSLQWDRGTRIYVTVEPRWRQRVQGLCGNFNDDQGDDFLTPSGGIPEARSSVFAESWKVQEFCPQPVAVEDTCAIHPHRKSWAQQKCGILKSEPFIACHSEVAMEPYYERCVFDSCACDIGGDCECLCTAIAAYAQECNMHGVHVKWRSQELCPIQCEECATYESCISSCPKKTCENELAYSRIELACSIDYCVEGCDPKPCPAGQIYNNGREFKCIPEIECVVPCLELNGRIYNEGDRITDVQIVDSCQTCHCLRGSISCTGLPCVSDQLPCLRTGWTPWMNTPAFVGGDFEVLTEPRLQATLREYCGIANMTDIDCRAVDTKQPYKETGQRVSCRLPHGLSCKDIQQKDSVCQDYEIRVYCDCGPIPTAEPTVTIPWTLPPVCDQTGWTAWMSGHAPSEEGEFETLESLRGSHYFCAVDMIENIECRTVINWKHVTEDENVVCNKKLGFMCKGPKCDDYEVRVYCNCGAEVATVPVPTCVTGWTEYFNTDHPDVSDTGDDESLDRIRSRHDFCVGGTIVDIECKAIVGDQLIDYKELDTFGLKCSKNVGFECNKFIRTEKCEDFTVRFFCACEPIPITIPELITPEPIATPIPVTPVPHECGWTPWLNIGSPESEIGDIEDLTKIQLLYKTCGGMDLIDIECRMARTLHKYSESLQDNLICNTKEGFRCLHEDQIGKCHDYEVRLLCMYPWCAPPTIPPALTTENPCLDGKVYDTCAFHCDHMCSSLSNTLHEECTTAPNGCIAGCRPAEGCEPPNMWRDYYTCVSKENCICTIHDESGTLVTVAPNEVIEIGCQKCQCLENNMNCHTMPGCGTTQVPSNRYTPTNILRDDCWTEWINTNNASKGGGDLEIPSKIRQLYLFCPDPVKIECRTVASHQKPLDVGQNVVCNVKEGLICWNKDNKPGTCYDYEIRFFCPCPTQVPTTVTPIPTLEPGPCLFGWTEWYNNHFPDNRGEYETIQSSRISNSFCSSDMISAIECRQVGKPVGELQHGVICDLDIGLKCNPEFLSGNELCGDYEVRFFCDCPIMVTVTEPPLPERPPIVSEPPLYKPCAYWSEWINDNHPTTTGDANGTKKTGVKGGGGNTGDTEKATILKLRREYNFCNEGEIADIECREAGTDVHYTETGDKSLLCNTLSGFRCKAKDQPNYLCKDYKIRYFCACLEPPTSPVLVKPTLPPINVPPCYTEYYYMVDGPSPLPDTSLKASTSKSSSSGPQSARFSSEDSIKSAGAWIAGKHNDKQFIEIDLGSIRPVYGVVTKGQNGHDSWVKSYKVLYSRDGTGYTYIKELEDPTKDKVFSGNYDSDSEVRHIFENGTDARFVRIQPLTFHKAIAMRVDLLGCSSGMPVVRTTLTPTGPPCIDEMGMYDGKIQDYQITTSSDRSPNSDGRYARLNTLQTEENSGGWVAGELDDNQFIQVDFLEPRNLTGLKTQGRDMVPQWVTAFYVSYSQDGEKWNLIKDQSGILIFSANYDSSTTVITYFDQPIRARFLRIHPNFWHNWIAMRFEVLGCYVMPTVEITVTVVETTVTTAGPPCVDDMGMNNGKIQDYQITTSSDKNPESNGRYARLNTLETEDNSGGWVAGELDDNQFIQVDFLMPRNLTGLKTQGRDTGREWVTAFYISYSQDGEDWNIMKDQYGTLIFPANSDSSTTVTTYFDHPIEARFLRIHPKFWEDWIAMRFEVLGCYESLEDILDTAGTTQRIIPMEKCTDAMGFENHQLPDTSITASSSMGPNSGVSRIRLNTHQEGDLTGGWIASEDDYMPRIYIDFLEERNLTGILTQGLEEDDLWVVSYKVSYSLDNKTWEYISDMEKGGLVFNGNTDRDTVIMGRFNRIITARFLEIIIMEYHVAAALRMEVLGCFIPYTILTTPTPAFITPTERCVTHGPWISLSDPASSVFGDEEPIDAVIAASGVCGNPFEIECRTQVTKKDSSQAGQLVTCDLTHGLLCKNEQQPSYHCYNYEVRIKCWECEEPTTPSPLEMCPEIPDSYRNSCPEFCPFGFACDGANCIPSTDCPCFRNGKKFEPSNMVITQDCQKCDCILGGLSRCEPIVCPDCLPGQKPEMDVSCHCGCVGCAIGTLLCPTSGECIEEERWCDGMLDCPDDETGCPTTVTLAPTTVTTPPTEMPLICSTDYLPDTDSCEMMANIFETFDGLTYQYDICDHILMKESSSGLYSVIVHKTCASEGTDSCYRYLIIDVDGLIIKLGPGLEDVTLKDVRIPVSTLWLVSKRFPDFELKKQGNTLIFRSFKYNFDVTWDSLGDARIIVSKCLLHNVVGLCGLYNKEMLDDRTMPNGMLASSNEEFGDSWAVGSLEKCRPPQCPPETMKTAMEICNQLREEPFSSSCYEYVKMESRVEACVVYMCECMQRSPLDARDYWSKDVDSFVTESCKCEAFESFAEACEAAKQGAVQNWRIQHDCTPECPIGMEWQDCGPGCELTCDNYREEAEICSKLCVPGCYCPSGLVRHHNRCVKPKMCQDCVCRGHGDPNYITFDGRYYSFQGICTYVLAQYQSPDDPKLNFKILVTNVECPEEPHTSCAQGLTIYWNGHVIEKFKNKQIYIDENALSPDDSPLDYEGISVTFVPNKSTIIYIQDINLAVRYFDQMYGFNIELPAFFYYNKTEGLCGVCNFIQSDDLYHRGGYVTEDVDDFAFSWLVERETRENCELVPEEVPEPPPGICNFTVSPCEVFMDPTIYSKSCQNDVSHSRRQEASMCRSKFQYAQQCCERGVSLVEWLQLSGCENTCPEGMVYECTSACQKTCDNYKVYEEDDCNLMPLYTCVCPEGEVLKHGRCVQIIQCEVCDADGHIVGDTWQEGPCKKCECLPDLSVSCLVTECPEPPICNVGETLQKLSRSNNSCCDAFQCMPKAEVVCPETPLEECPPGQAYVKDYKDGCPVYRCQCIEDLCPPPVRPVLDDGENFTLVMVDCCTEYRVVCDLNSCAPPPECGPGFKLSTYQGRCCEKYTCIPKKNVCVYRHKYDLLNGAQVDLAPEDYYDMEYEPGASWQDGLCRQCSCVDSGGQFAYSCREEKCPDPSDFPDADKYFREKIHNPGACCPKYRRTACISQGIKYQIDEDWPSPEGDPCKSYRCIMDQNGEAVIQVKTSMCQTTCPENAIYVGAKPGSGKCCGMCKLIACEENGVLYKNGETWISKAKPCFSAECSVTENGTRISYKGESCPIMPDNCPPEHVKTDPKGCCSYCKVPTESCSAVEVPVYETRGFFGYSDNRKGLCSNEEVLHGLTKCGGQCSSQSRYSDLIGDFQSVCNCCLPKESRNRTISLECEDGSKVQKVYMQPITCMCLFCSGSSRDLKDLNDVEPYRK